MAAARFDMTAKNKYPIEQGATLIVDWLFYADETETTVRDLSGVTAAEWVAKVSFDANDVYLRRTLGSGISWIMSSSTRIGLRLILTAAETALLDPVIGGKQNLKVTFPSNIVERVTEGDFDTTPEARQ